jgi:hypothetical protein
MKSAPSPPLMFVNGAFGSSGFTRTKARTRKVSSSSSPNRNSSARFRYTVNESLPMPPKIVVDLLIPFDR